jgi:hypothetical protein
MTPEQMLIAAIGALAAAVVTLFLKLEKRGTELIKMAERMNNGFTALLEKICEILDRYNFQEKENKEKVGD